MNSTDEESRRLIYQQNQAVYPSQNAYRPQGQYQAGLYQGGNVVESQVVPDGSWSYQNVPPPQVGVPERTRAKPDPKENKRRKKVRDTDDEDDTDDDLPEPTDPKINSKVRQFYCRNSIYCCFLYIFFTLFVLAFILSAYLLVSITAGQTIYEMWQSILASLILLHGCWVFCFGIGHRMTHSSSHLAYFRGLVIFQTILMLALVVILSFRSVTGFDEYILVPGLAAVLFVFILYILYVTWYLNFIHKNSGYFEEHRDFFPRPRLFLGFGPGGVFGAPFFGPGPHHAFGHGPIGGPGFGGPHGGGPGGFGGGRGGFR